MEQPFGFLAGS